jgi:hypothetical protein
LYLKHRESERLLHAFRGIVLQTLPARRRSSPQRPS